MLIDKNITDTGESDESQSDESDESSESEYESESEEEKKGGAKVGKQVGYISNEKFSIVPSFCFVTKLCFSYSVQLCANQKPSK